MTLIENKALENDILCSEINTVLEKMEVHGGSFEKGLAKALRYADLGNARRIKEAFPELWVKWLNW